MEVKDATTMAPKIMSSGKEDESLDETSRTLHEPRKTTTNGDDYTGVVAEKTAQVIPASGGLSASLKLDKRVAEIALKAYHRASEDSSVLSRASLNDIAVVRFDELEIGKFLGKGSFSDVHEITKITAITKIAAVDDSADTGERRESLESVLSARTLLTKHHKRGTCDYRYAIKFLREDVRNTPDKYVMGTTDLVIEGMFLASIAHPNIIKVRGFPMRGVMSLCDEDRLNRNGYFLILDRLYNTLSDQMYKVWKEDHIITIEKKYGFITPSMKKKERDKNLAERLKVAFDVSAALKYLHSKNILYRDLKPENLGFDVRGDIKLFDLGLVKELHRGKMDKNGNYLLSMAGTPRYMAPEVGLYNPYNLSADVYSISMLLWEMLTLDKPFANYSYSMLRKNIFIEGERPCMKKVFNKKMAGLICSGWSQNPAHRPTMDKVYEELKSEYVKLSPHTVTEGEVTHSRRRSTFVVVNRKK